MLNLEVSKLASFQREFWMKGERHLKICFQACNIDKNQNYQFQKGNESGIYCLFGLWIFGVITSLLKV